MNPRKEATYRMLSLIAAMIFVLPCVCLVFPTFDIHLDNLWQMDSLMAFILSRCNFQHRQSVLVLLHYLPPRI